MVYKEKQCVGCPSELGCMGEGCPNRNISVLVCDDCGEEVDELYVGNDGGQYCDKCVLDYLEKVKI